MIRVADIIAKRKRIWEEKHDLELDRELVRASVRQILSDINIVNEIRAKPYLLIEVAFYMCHSSSTKCKETLSPSMRNGELKRHTSS